MLGSLLANYLACRIICTARPTSIHRPCWLVNGCWRTVSAPNHDDCHLDHMIIQKAVALRLDLGCPQPCLVIRILDSSSCLALSYGVGDWRPLLPRRYTMLQMLHALRHHLFRISFFSLVGRMPKKFALRRPSDIASWYLLLTKACGYLSRLRSRSGLEVVCLVCELRSAPPFVAQQLPFGVRCS